MGHDGFMPNSQWVWASSSATALSRCSCNERAFGVPGAPQFRRVPHVATASDLVERRPRRDDPDRLWVTDITEHPTREGKLYCAVVLDVFSRRVVGSSMDWNQETSPRHRALGMAIANREPADDTIIHGGDAEVIQPAVATPRSRRCAWDRSQDGRLQRLVVARRCATEMTERGAFIEGRFPLQARRRLRGEKTGFVFGQRSLAE